MIKFKINESSFDNFRHPTHSILTSDSLRGQNYFNKNLLPETFPNKKTYLLTDRKSLSYRSNELGPMIESLDDFTDEDIFNSVFYIFFNFDVDALPLLKRIRKAGGTYIPHLDADKVKYHHASRYALESFALTQMQAQRISHIHQNIWDNICEALDITKKLEGDYVEIGVYKGGSALLAMNCMDLMRVKGDIKERKAYLFDTFDGFNYEEAEGSSDIIWDKTHELFGVEETQSYLKETFKDVDTKYKLIKNNICKDDLPKDIEKIVVANIDVDMYEPTLDALNKVSDLVVKGGVVIVEDATSTPCLYGAYLAMEEFLETEKGQSFVKVFKDGQYFLIKV